MTRRLVVRPAAVADLAAIWDYTADRWGIAQAAAYVRDLFETRARTGAIGGHVFYR